MLKDLFTPRSLKNDVNHYLIGYQHLVVINYQKTKEQIIIDQVIAKLFLSFVNLYFFKSYEEMERDLDLLITYTNENYLVIISS